jgi:metal-sulfur cluster biosynthetic enzyme
MPWPNQPALLSDADILNALRDCYMPGTPLNIVDLGLVHSITIAPDPEAPGSGIPGVPPRHRVTVGLILSESTESETGDSDIAESDIAEPIAEPAGSSEAQSTQLPALIQNRLAAFETISRTEVILLDEPAWSPGRMTPAGREYLAHRLTSKHGPTPPDALIQIQLRPKNDKEEAPT